MIASSPYTAFLAVVGYLLVVGGFLAVARLILGPRRRKLPAHVRRRTVSKPSGGAIVGRVYPSRVRRSALPVPYAVGRVQVFPPGRGRSLSRPQPVARLGLAPAPGVRGGRGGHHPNTVTLVDGGRR